MLSFGLSMSGRDETRGTDVVLLPFLKAGESDSEQLLARLVSDQAEPVARSVIGYKLRVFLGQGIRHNQDAEDVYGDVIRRLLSRLYALRQEPDRDGNTISNFRGYVRVIASNACSEYLRRKYPQRSRLEDKLRYLLSHREGLASWKSEDDEWVCGYDSWREQPGQGPRSAKSAELRDNPAAFAAGVFPDRDIQRMSLLELVSAIFKWLDGPIELDDLVQVVAGLQGIKDVTARVEPSSSDERQYVGIEIRDPGAGAEAELGQRLSLERLWNEICQLPVRQRFALIMNLRDPQGSDLASLLPLTGVCTFRELAEALDLVPERLAELFTELPLDDTTIARYLEITRQQVINLRKSARQRLARRMKGFER